MADPEHREEEETSETVAGGEDEDTGAQVAPIVKLEEVTVTTGEEEEDVLLDLKAKLYRFDKDGNQWKERGAGTVKLLKHKTTKKVRLVMRQSKTLKICANHLVLSTTSIQEHAGNEKSCVWHATDFSDGELKEELFCIRFASIENCKKFKEMVEEVAEGQETKAEEGEAAAASKEKKAEEDEAAAELIEKLSVGETKEEKKAEEDEAAAELIEKLSVGETKEEEKVKEPTPVKEKAEEEASEKKDEK